MRFPRSAFLLRLRDASFTSVLRSCFHFTRLVLFSLLIPHAVNATEDVAAGWRSVTAIQGSISIENTSWVREKDKKGEARETAEVNFKMVLDATVSLPHMTWRAESATIRGLIQTSGTTTNYGSSTTNANFSGEPASLPDFTMTLDTETGVWQIVSPAFLKEPYDLVVNHSGDPNPGYEDRTYTLQENKVRNMVFDGSVSGAPGTTVGSSSYVQPPMEGQPDRGSTTVGRIHFSPEFDDVELEVTIADYATWRPLGSIKAPSTPGNHLLARATLKSKDGRAMVPPQVKEFRFKLLDTSREPGVCMNWPLEAKDKDYDLRLALPPAFTGTLANHDQALTITDAQSDENNQAYAEATLNSYDFGAKAELQVTALLDDGREISGEMKAADGSVQTLVRLPRRLNADWIAAIWLEENQAENLAADDDDEKVKGQKHNGDGFTLYEEYRGWVENGRHVEGDPARKDVFIYSFLGAVGQPGIALFGRAGKLRVHGKLQAGEMNTVERLMNGNHRDAPHRVDQHGICIAPGTKDAGAVGIDGVNKRLAFRPRYASHAYVTLRDVEHSTFSVKESMKEYGFNQKDAESMFDRAVAHELLHIVGVDHHGEVLNTSRWVSYQGAKDYFNPTKKPRFTSSWAPSAWLHLRNHPDRDLESMGRGNTVTLLWEDTRKNLAEEVAPEYERKLAEQRASTAANPNSHDEYVGLAKDMAHIGGDAAFWSEHEDQWLAAQDFNRAIRIMQTNGTESGNEQCLMRYYFGNAYAIKGQKDSYYLMRPGANKVGMQLCASPRGSGGNAADHSPQSRAGDAWAEGHRGDCFSNVCPNDAIPPNDVYQ